MLCFGSKSPLPLPNSKLRGQKGPIDALPILYNHKLKG